MRKRVAAPASAAKEKGLPELAPGRGGYAHMWRRLRRNRVAVVSGTFILLLVIACFIAEPIAEHLLGHGPDDIFSFGANANGKPVGPWTHVPTLPAGEPVTAKTPRTLFILGGDGPLGRDEFLRLLAGGRTSLEVALGATALAILIGTTLGAIAGFYGGSIDVVLSRLSEFAMGFPILFLFIAIGLTTISIRVNTVTLRGVFVPGALGLILVIGVFNWFYLARVVRAHVLSLREQQFIEAARMIGARNIYIVRKHILPHLVDTIIVYGSLIVAATIMLEAALSVFNLGIPVPNASWGNLIATNWGTLLIPGGPTTYQTSFWTTFWPTAALFATVFAFALFAEGLRSALDPYGS
ncbi:MAG: ABC transporter permease [Gaiellaceae bacterium]